MKKVFVIISIFVLLCAHSAPCQEIEIDSEVVTVDSGLEFFIIGAGGDDGVDLGDGLIVHRLGETIAEAYIIEVRPGVSAAEILNVQEGEGIREGDGILIVKEIGETETRTAIEPGFLVGPGIVKEGDIISLDIKSSTKEVFAYARLILIENGFSIISSNRSIGILMATKPIALSITKELWADAVAAIDHNLVVSLDIKGEGRLSELRVSSFKEHSQKGKHVKRAIARDSKHYNELRVLVSTIKERSEH